MAKIKVRVWAFNWEDAGGPGHKLFPSESEFHAYLHDQIADCRSPCVRRLLMKNNVEDAFRAWANEPPNEPSYRFEWNVYELEYPFPSKRNLISNRVKGTNGRRERKSA